jgi:hypothetical protein
MLALRTQVCHDRWDEAWGQTCQHRCEQRWHLPPGIRGVFSIKIVQESSASKGALILWPISLSGLILAARLLIL